MRFYVSSDMAPVLWDACRFGGSGRWMAVCDVFSCGGSEWVMAHESGGATTVTVAFQRALLWMARNRGTVRPFHVIAGSTVWAQAALHRYIQHLSGAWLCDRYLSEFDARVARVVSLLLRAGLCDRALCIRVAMMSVWDSAGPSALTYINACSRADADAAFTGHATRLSDGLYNASALATHTDA